VFPVDAERTVGVNTLDQTRHLLLDVGWQVLCLSFAEIFAQHLQAHSRSSKPSVFSESSHHEVIVSVDTLHFASLY